MGESEAIRKLLDLEIKNAFCGISGFGIGLEVLLPPRGFCGIISSFLPYIAHAFIHGGLMIGQKVTGKSGRIFTVLREIGRGGFGVVYLVADENNSEFALKLIAPVSDPSVRLSFEQEVQSTLGLAGENLLAVIDYGECLVGSSRGLFTVMEYCPDGDYRDVLSTSTERQISLEEIVGHIRQVLEGLKVLHTKTIHRDLKPENVLVAGDTLKIGDFGLAKFVDEATRTLTFKRIYAVGSQRKGELVRYDAKSGQFAPYLSGISAAGVSFSPDGQWVTYSTFPEAILWRSRADGSGKLQLTYKPFQAMSPRWSPDGKQIVFSGAEAGKIWGLYLVTAEGSAPQPLLIGEREFVFPNWTPDGKAIIFQESGNYDYALKSLDVKSREVSSLPGSENLITPTVSPDGHYLAAATSDRQKLMLFDFTTRQWVELANAYVGSLNWSADGKGLYFDSGSSDKPNISRLRIADRKLERVVSLEAFRRVIFAAYPWSGLTSDGSPLLLRDIGSQEVYALDFEGP